jgi:hypothetical protein
MRLLNCEFEAGRTILQLIADVIDCAWAASLEAAREIGATILKLIAYRGSVTDASD